MSGGPIILADGRIYGTIIGYLDDPGRSSFFAQMVGLSLMIEDLGRVAPEAPEGRHLSDAELKALARTVTVRVLCHQ